MPHMGTPNSRSVPFNFDVRKVGTRYGVFDVRDNAPLSKTFFTRGEARNFMNELYDEALAMQTEGYGADTLQKWLEEHKKSRFKFSAQGEPVGAGGLNEAKVS